MLSAVDPVTFGQNLILLIGALVLLGGALVLLVATWRGVKVLLALRAGRRARKAYLRAARRADGVCYPPAIEGTCTHCRRADRRIYFPSDSLEELCPRCYERYWREVEAGTLIPSGANRA